MNLGNAETWDFVANGYATSMLPVMAGFSTVAISTMRLTSSEVVADIACGPGTLSVVASPIVRHVNAVDFSKQMLVEIDRALSSQKLHNVDMYLADAQDLPFADRSHDAAFSMFGLMYFPDRSRGYSEIWRILKPGGRICISSWASAERGSLTAVTVEALKRVEPRVPDLVPDMTSLENPVVLHRELCNAGFNDVSIAKITLDTRFETPQHLWEDMVAGTAPIALMRAEMDPNAWTSKSQHAVAWLRDNQGPFPRTFATTAYLGMGSKPNIQAHR